MTADIDQNISDDNEQTIDQQEPKRLEGDYVAYLSNLSFNFTDKEVLKQALVKATAPYGIVEADFNDIHLPVRQMTFRTEGETVTIPQSKGFAFVQMTNEHAYNTLLSLSGFGNKNRATESGIKIMPPNCTPKTDERTLNIAPQRDRPEGETRDQNRSQNRRGFGRGRGRFARGDSRSGYTRSNGERRSAETSA